jgi:hypothetical protein
MSAAESERVQVDVAPGEFVDDDRADEGDTASAADSSRSFSSIREMLTSTEPSESPEMQDGTFSTGAEWYQHLELAVKKATGASGTPAWLNGIMAAFLLAAESAGLDLGGGSQSSTPGASDESPSSASPTGAVAGTHDNGETSVIG